jgi:predicted GNAT family N-acyltransferase
VPYELVERTPTVDEYLALRAHVGWNELRDREAVARGLEGSLFAVCVERDGELVGIGRLIGDGGIYAYVQDVIVVEPDRGQGLSRLIMDALVRFLDGTYPEGAFIGLMAARGVAGLYERYGFVRRDDDAPGMYRYRD